MKEPLVIDIDRGLAQLASYSAVIDARSESEYAEDHLPGAVNMPVLDDAERALIGTMYKQVSPFAARRAGAALVARNIARILEERLADRDRDWAPLVYCWRGGNRSGALATVLARVGWRTTVLAGGYREFRRRVVADLADWPERLRFVVVAGRTGSGKSLVLERLARRGAQVLDLERLAEHRGSVLGLAPGARQPAQKAFETRVWDALRGFDAARPVYVESESRKVGQCHVPARLIERMRASACVVIDAADDVRVALLLGEYRHFVEAPQRLYPQLEALVALHGRHAVDGWRALAADGRWHALVASLLHRHYDPAYDRSMARNFARLPDAPRMPLAAYDDAALDALAERIEGLG